MSEQTVLLTGATGYIAKHIAVQLLNADFKVRATLRNLDRASEITAAITPHVDEAENLADRISFVALDLGSDDGWGAAMNGVDILMHTASPFPMAQPKDANDTIRPAVDGALRALTAAHANGIKRVVMTSSCVAIMEKDLAKGQTQYTEEDWSDLTRTAMTPYSKSKTLAEKAAWDFVSNQAPEMELTVINPGLVVGAPLDTHFGTSVALVTRILSGADPMMPKYGVPMVDVQDVAQMHVAALSKPQSIGKRFVANAESMWFIDIAKTLKAAYPDRNISTRLAPNFMLRLLAVFDKSIRSLLPSLGQKPDISNKQAREILDIEFKPPQQSLRETAAFLIKHDAA
ncbi:MAG: aldehyde reductase [Paracoccaceae bacterium]|nr:aldehyde reductase [Paracoccaceae bacterium]